MTFIQIPIHLITCNPGQNLGAFQYHYQYSGLKFKKYKQCKVFPTQIKRGLWEFNATPLSL